jgi:hypothetical protein
MISMRVPIAVCALGFSLSVFAESSEFCAKESKEARESCSKWTDGAVHDSNAYALAQDANSGMYKGSGSQVAASAYSMERLSGADSSCKRAREYVQKACDEQARKHQGEEGSLAEIRQNWEDARDNIDSRRDQLAGALGTGAGTLQTAGVGGGTAVNNVSH